MTTLGPVAELNQLVSELRRWNTFVFGGNASQQGGVGMMKQQMLDRLAPIADALSSIPEQTWTPEKYAEQLAIAIRERCYPEVPQFEPMTGDIMGLLSQIDNMTTGMVRSPPSHPAAVAVTDEMVEAADYLIERLYNISKGIPVRDLDEAWAAYRSARAALRSTP